ncbi:MAG TPA: cysteine desulfurase NifS [Phycisphaerales bacterium]|nr:cysteine desulfurase NifS [Phycisphaerales bacterium]
MTHAESVYLDANATTIAHPEVIDSMVSCMNEHGNPSSLHRAGQSARRRVELARAEVAALVGVPPSEIVFTSGGTEVDNLAIAGTLDAIPGRRRVLVAEVEHAAVRECVQRLARLGRCELVNLPVDDCGIVRPKVVEDAIAADPDNTALVSVMWANNETGVVQPIADIGAVCRTHGVRFHTDAIQAIGRIPVDLSEVPVDLLTLSGHKFHGPKGIGALVVRPGLRLSPQNIGGPQERERRGGTENVPGVVGLGVAARLAQAWLASSAPVECAKWQPAFERTMRAAIPDVVVHSECAQRLWNTSCLGFPGRPAEGLLLQLSESGVACSAGSACASGSMEPMHSLLAVGMD